MGKFLQISLKQRHNQEDLAFERIINTPARGIGKKTLENIQLVALNHQISLYDALTLHSDEIRLSNKSKKKCEF